jgi:multicomponent Na+:H+ antiporter subunit D
LLTSHLVLLPIVIPLVGAMVGLLLYRQRPLQDYWTFGTILTSLAASTWLLVAVWQAGEPLVFQSGGWQAPIGISLVGDLLSVFFVVMSQLVLAMGILYALGCKDQCVTYPAFYPLFLTLGVGLTGAFLTGDIFNLFVFAELLMISGTVLTAISDDRYGPEAAYKYFYISLLAANFLLLAVGSLYVSYGTLNMAQLGELIAANPQRPLLPFAVAFLLCAFMVKSATFPFHFWQPDFHTAAPTPVHAVLSSVVVKLGIYGFLRMTHLLFLEQADLIRLILIIAGVIGVFYGGLGAAGTYDAKRMLAYSTMGQLGFILVGIGWGTTLSITAAIVFAFNHSLAKSAMLMLAGSVASHAPVKSAVFTVIQGVGKVVPFTGILFFLGSLALAGIPPTNGFISKFLLFNSGIDAAGYWPLFLIGIGSSITLVYTMRAYMRIWWHDQLPDTGEPKRQGDRLYAPALLIGLVLLFGLWSDPLINLAQTTSLWLQDPMIYVRAVMVEVGP